MEPDQKTRLERVFFGTIRIVPELPEVETTRAGIAPTLLGHRVREVIVRQRRLRWPITRGFETAIRGHTVRSVERRAKYILAHLEGGLVLAMHLGMTGRFSVSAVSAKGRKEAPSSSIQLGDYVYEHGRDVRHDHIVFTLRNGTVITYNDARRFGYMALIPRDGLAEDPFFAGLGVEPLGKDLTPKYLAGQALGRRTDLKAFLMDQRIIAGLGNIYVCEAAFRAGLSPFKPAASLATRTGAPKPAADRLVREIKAVLEEAIRAGGSTLRDYQDAHGNSGSFQQSFFVYGREGEPCLRKGCRGTVRRKTQGGRSTFYCPVCQR